MNFFEYTIEIPINETSEKITASLLDAFKSGLCPFNLHNMTDVDYDNKKTRTIIIMSMYNIHKIIFDLFNGTEAKFRCYYKTAVYM